MTCFALLTLLFTSLNRQPPSTDPPVSVTIDDRSPKFLAFYSKATAENADEAERWKLWKEMYHFAAVPPTPEGEQMARKMLDQAWPRYAVALPRIRTGAAVFHPSQLLFLKMLHGSWRPTFPSTSELSPM